MSTGIYLRPIEVFSQVDPAALIELDAAVEATGRLVAAPMTDDDSTAGCAKRSNLNFRAAPSGISNDATGAMQAVIEPVQRDLREYLGFAATSLVQSNVLIFERSIAQPEQAYINYGRKWHTDVQRSGHADTRIDSHDGTEILQGEIPQELLDYMEEHEGFVMTDGNVAEMRQLGIFLEAASEVYSDDALAAMGLYWVQPVPGGAQVLWPYHIHRSPVNKTEEPSTRLSVVSSHSFFEHDRFVK